MDIWNSVAPVTGANRGLGRHFAAQLLERGAKVYAGGLDLPGLFLGWMFTDLAGFIADDRKVNPAAGARAAFDGGAAGVPEVLTGATAQHVKSSLSA